MSIAYVFYIAPAHAQVEKASQHVDHDEPAPKISVTASPQQDRTIDKRLTQIFSELEGAKSIHVEVRSGVVTLSGTTLSQKASQQAANLARQVEGVVEVKDETTIVRDLERQIETALERLGRLFSDIIGYLPLLLFSIAIFLGFWFLAFLLGKWNGLYRRFTANEFFADFLRQLVKLGVIGIGLLISFELLDATALIGTVLGAAGLLGLALGFALRDTVENYLAGILLSMKQPFIHHDWVNIEGHEGYVVRLTSRATIIMTLDGNHVRIPNATVFNGIVINYTRNPQRQLHFDIGVSNETNLVSAQHLAATTLLDMEGIMRNPPPRTDVQEIGDFNVILRVFAWVDQRHFNFLKVKSEAIRLVKEAYDRAGVVIPEPIYNVKIQQQIQREDGTEGLTPIGGPLKPIDIERNTELEQQIAEERRKTQEKDLLHLMHRGNSTCTFTANHGYLLPITPLTIRKKSELILSQGLVLKSTVNFTTLRRARRNLRMTDEERFERR